MAAIEIVSPANKDRPEKRNAFVGKCAGEIFVLIHQEMFERVRGVLEREDGIAEIEEMYPLAAEILDSGESASKR